MYGDVDSNEGRSRLWDRSITFSDRDMHDIILLMFVNVFKSTFISLFPPISPSFSFSLSITCFLNINCSLSPSHPSPPSLSLHSYIKYIILYLHLNTSTYFIHIYLYLYLCIHIYIYIYISVYLPWSHSRIDHPWREFVEIEKVLLGCIEMVSHSIVFSERRTLNGMRGKKNMSGN